MIKWNASGAFVAYVIVLLLIVYTPPLKHLVSTTGANYTPVWTVKIDDVQTNNLERVFFKPDIHYFGSESATLKIPARSKEEIPDIIFIWSGGSNTLDINSLSDELVEVKGFTITVKKGIFFKEIKGMYKPKVDVYHTGMEMPQKD